MSLPEERWRSGVILRWEHQAALVEADKYDRLVVVRVKGDILGQRRMLALIRENFIQIHSDMGEMKPTEFLASERDPELWMEFGKHGLIESLHGESIFVTEERHVGIQTSRSSTQLLLHEKSSLEFARLKREQPIKIFVSYAHEDEKWREMIRRNLDLIEYEGLATIWFDHMIAPGANWDEEIHQKLHETDIYLCLLSTDFLSSRYIHDEELPYAIERCRQRKAELVPVILRQCSWKNYLGSFKALPTDGLPVKQWKDRDVALHGVEQGLRVVINNIKEKRKSKR